MRKLVAILTILTFTSCKAQSTFTYNWQIENGVLKVKYKNIVFGDYSIKENYIPSNAKYGYWECSCRQTYLDFIGKLIQYGNQPNRQDGYQDRTDNLEIITDKSFGFILLINNTFENWKLPKSEALLLASQLNQPIWVNLIPICPE